MIAAVEKISANLRLPELGFDSDNGSEFFDQLERSELNTPLVGSRYGRALT